MEPGSARLCAVARVRVGSDQRLLRHERSSQGVAIRNLDLDRRHFVGAASLASFAGDATKTAIFAEADLLGRTSLLIAAAAIPLMIAGTWTGSTINRKAGEKTFAVLFWSVMTGYSIRLGIFLL